MWIILLLIAILGVVTAGTIFAFLAWRNTKGYVGAEVMVGELRTLSALIDPRQISYEGAKAALQLQQAGGHSEPPPQQVYQVHVGQPPARRALDSPEDTRQVERVPGRGGPAGETRPQQIAARAAESHAAPAHQQPLRHDNGTRITVPVTMRPSEPTETSAPHPLEGGEGLHTGVGSPRARELTSGATASATGRPTHLGDYSPNPAAVALAKQSPGYQPEGNGSGASTQQSPGATNFGQPVQPYNGHDGAPARTENSGAQEFRAFGSGSVPRAEPDTVTPPVLPERIGEVDTVQLSPAELDALGKEYAESLRRSDIMPAAAGSTLFPEGWTPEQLKVEGTERQGAEAG